MSIVDFEQAVGAVTTQGVVHEPRHTRRQRGVVAPFVDMREPVSLADRIARVDHALTAAELSEFLNMAVPTIYEHARDGRIPSFRVGTLVRFDPFAVAKWLRTQ